MKKYNTIICKAFKTAAESRDDFTRLLNMRGYVDNVVKMAYSRHIKALDAIKAIGGERLVQEFSSWYMEDHKR